MSDPALEENMFGRIMLFDGRNGSVLSWMPTPDRKEVYYPPQVLWGVDGDQHILFGTGGSSTPGSLWVISLMDLYRKRVDKVGLHLRMAFSRLTSRLCNTYTARARLISITFLHNAQTPKGRKGPYRWSAEPKPLDALDSGQTPGTEIRLKKLIRLN